MQYNFIICHYAEIGLKGKNRRFFEEGLIENIKKSFILNSCDGLKNIKRISGRILIQISGRHLSWLQAMTGKDNRMEEDRVRQALKNVFGIAYFSFAVDCKQNIGEIKKKSFEILKNKKFKTFRIETKRAEKDFSLTSQQINQQTGEYVLRKLKAQNAKLKVNLGNPDITCFIEIVEKYAFLYLEKIKGLGGLPVSVSGKAISLLSGGIDSPVASFYGMQRGIKIIFLHFTSYPFTEQASIEKVKKIVKILNKFQFQSKLYLIPFLNIQKEILLKTKAKLRVVLYRRFMFKIAEVLAKEERIKVLITGESVGQVASQTLENIKVIQEATKLLILRPLIGMDKEDIIKKGKDIGTFDISILPAQDCCQRFLPKHPETRANLKKVEEEEKKLDVEKLIKEAVKKLKVEKI
ncbi:tRNA 4-thiouridine(8) synthase ThiI [Candidatus Atribacteria bacterium MT.SAG.1]|nr:tRNA 4-thiouridine(8) synthase ThiI [Candidatus Atribacteria bacterium MT.SAG.1]